MQLIFLFPVRSAMSMQIDKTRRNYQPSHVNNFFSFQWFRTDFCNTTIKDTYIFYSIQFCFRIDDSPTD